MLFTVLIYKRTTALSYTYIWARILNFQNLESRHFFVNATVGLDFSAHGGYVQRAQTDSAFPYDKLSNRNHILSLERSGFTERSTDLPCYQLLYLSQSFSN